MGRQLWSDFISTVAEFFMYLVERILFGRCKARHLNWAFFGLLNCECRLCHLKGCNEYFYLDHCLLVSLKLGELKIFSNHFHETHRIANNRIELTDKSCFSCTCTGTCF